jgi:gamma-glutamylputrescine oxidase
MPTVSLSVTKSPLHSNKSGPINNTKVVICVGQLWRTIQVVTAAALPPTAHRSGQIMLASEEQLTRNSYYLASAGKADDYPPLNGSIDCDVCVVGGGLAGLSAAIELRQAGFSVAVLEGERIGWGASGRNGGQALNGLACDMSVIRHQLGEVAASQVWDMTLEAVRLIGERCQTFGIDCQWQSGYLSAAIGHKKANELRAWVDDQQQRYGYHDLEYIEHSDIHHWIASDRYHGLAYDPHGGHLHPLLYTRGLARAAASLGARIFENTRATELRQGDKPVVQTTNGQVRCQQVLLAGNVYLEPLVKKIAPRIMPVGTFIAASTAMDKARADALIPSRSAICDTQFVLDYFRLSADHRMLFGGRVSYSTIAPMDLAASMRKRMVTVFPQLDDLSVEFAWGGYVDITMNRAPDFGRIGNNVYYLQGFSGHGLALTGLAGRLAAEAMAGQSQRFDVFAQLRHRPFPGGGALRTPALVLAMAWYRLRDLLG